MRDKKVACFTLDNKPNIKNSLHNPQSHSTRQIWPNFATRFTITLQSLKFTTISFRLYPDLKRSLSITIKRYLKFHPAVRIFAELLSIWNRSEIVVLISFISSSALRSRLYHFSLSLSKICSWLTSKSVNPWLVLLQATKCLLVRGNLILKVVVSSSHSLPILRFVWTSKATWGEILFTLVDLIQDLPISLLKWKVLSLTHPQFVTRFRNRLIMFRVLTRAIFVTTTTNMSTLQKLLHNRWIIRFQTSIITEILWTHNMDSVCTKISRRSLFQNCLKMLRLALFLEMFKSCFKMTWLIQRKLVNGSVSLAYISL